MENSIRSTETDIDHDSLLFASAILLDANSKVRDIQTLIAFILCCAMIGISITDNAIDLFTHESQQLE